MADRPHIRIDSRGRAFVGYGVKVPLPASAALKDRAIDEDLR
jgi:hypothetical protein